jgi:hypothetical protein
VCRRIKNELVDRPLLEQFLLELRVRDDAFFYQQLGECVSHCDSRYDKFFERYSLPFSSSAMLLLFDDPVRSRQHVRRDRHAALLGGF